MRSFFRNLSIFFPHRYINRLHGSNLIIPLYHLVSDRPPPHVRNLYPVVDIRRFEIDLEFLLKHFTPVLTDQLLAVSDKRFNSLKPPMILTFDDGYAEINDIIAPILLRKGIPAIFFVNPSTIDNHELMFRCKISVIYEKIRTLDRISCQKVLTRLKGNGLSSILSILRIDDESNSIINDIANFLDLNFDDYLMNNKPYLSTNQLVELSEKGFMIGGHGYHHRYFSHLNFDGQLNEVNSCMTWINTHFPGQMKLFAFPFTDVGVELELFNYIYENQIVDLTFGTSGIRKSIYPKHLQRIPMEVNNLTAKKIVGGEILYYLAKQTIGLQNRV